MPAESKGRKKGRNRERRRAAGTQAQAPEHAAVPDQTSPPPSPEARAVQAGMVEPRMPSPFARATGAMLAIMTGVVAIFMLNNGLQDDNTGAALARIGAGVMLLLISAVVGVLSVAPELVRSWIWRRRG